MWECRSPLLKKIVMRDVTPGVRIAFSSPFALWEADTEEALWASGLCSPTLPSLADCTLPLDFCIWTAGCAGARSRILLFRFPPTSQFPLPQTSSSSFTAEESRKVTSLQCRQCFIISKRTGWRSHRPFPPKSWVIMSSWSHGRLCHKSADPGPRITHNGPCADLCPSTAWASIAPHSGSGEECVFWTAAAVGHIYKALVGTSLLGCCTPCKRLCLL